MSPDLPGLETSLGDAWKLQAEGGHENNVGKLVESPQLALEDKQFNNMIPINTAAAISDNHKDEIDSPSSYKAAMESLRTKRWDTAI